MCDCLSKTVFFSLLGKLQGTPVNIIVGSHVWVEDTDVAWIDGQVEKINGQDVDVQATNGKKASSTIYSTKLSQSIFKFQHQY